MSINIYVQICAKVNCKPKEYLCIITVVLTALENFCFLWILSVMIAVTVVVFSVLAFSRSRAATHVERKYNYSVCTSISGWNIIFRVVVLYGN